MSFPILKRVPGVPLILYRSRDYGTCVIFIFIVGGSFFGFIPCNGTVSVCMSARGCLAMVAYVCMSADPLQ